MKSIIELAREAKCWPERGDLVPPAQEFRERIERFATLVRAQALEEAAGVCDDKHDEWRFGDGEDAASGPKDCAAAIRKLKEQT